MFSPLVPPQEAAPDNAARDHSIRDVTLATFKADVLEASKNALVLVEFWATWCEPCKQLMPVLEKLARASKGVVKLAKLDIDKNQQIAQQMGVQSVPAVFAFYQARPVDGFAGALPESEVKAWIDQIIHKIAAAGGVLSGDEKPGLDTALKQAADFLAAGDIDTAQSIYADILDMEPANAPSYAGFIKCLLALGQMDQAKHMMAEADPAMLKDKIFDPIRAAIELAEQAGEAGDTAALEAKLKQNEGDHQARFDLAMGYYAAGRREEAVDQLLEIVRRARTWNEEAARKQLIKFFEAFGVMDPLTVSARKRLSSIMFS